MTKYRVLFVLLLHCLISPAQSDKVSIHDLKPYNTVKDSSVFDKNHFPEISYQNKKIAENINNYLQVEHLEHLPGKFKKNPFEIVEYDEDNCCSYVVFYSWEKQTTPKNILSLKIEGEGSGAYPEGFEQYANFDLTTGGRILMKDFLKADKTKELVGLLNQKFKKRATDYLLEIRKFLADPKIVGEERDRYNEQDTMYTNCIEDHKDATLSYYEYYFSKDSITFVLGRCSNHAMRALDDLDRYFIPIAYKDLEKYLSPYGKSLIDNKTVTVIPTKSPGGKIFKGTIGTIPITLMMDEIEEDGSFSLHYWYDKHRTPIECSGKFTDTFFSMIEYNSDNPAAKIQGDWINNKITGTWKDLKTGKELKLELSLYP